ncbi:hypothetical protein BPAE_0175g00070 [Botrytis paeoniae]|uniref:Uncharacterized protein n=1 Tax=Botrytis paeoniae TaxID=278948 RepID=A0A4Z1FG57_9HELO|nr:hypothetical protein BPAE_0175g00070 [Botrytis paeoniae]
MVTAQRFSNLSEAHNGPLAPWKIREQSKRKDTHSPQDNVQQPHQMTVSIFSSQYILGYNVMNPDEIPKTSPLVPEREGPAGLNYKKRKHWHHQKKFYTKIAGMQEEWLGFSDDEEEPAEAPEDRSQQQEFNGFSDEIDDGPIEFPRLREPRTSTDTSSEDENFDEVTRHHRLTNDLGSPSSPVAEPVVPLLERGLSHSRKLRTRSSLPTSIGRVTSHPRPRTPVRSERSNSISHHAAPPNLSQSNTRRPSADKFSSRNVSTQTNLSYSSTASVLLEEADQISSAGGTEGLLSMSHDGMEHSNSRLVTRNISKQDRGIHTSPNVAHVTSMLATAFQLSTIGSCAMRATLLSRIAPAKPRAFFPALDQHPPAAVFAVASPTRVLPIINSSLSVAASSTNIGGVALDGHLRSEFPAQVQLFNSIPATALQIPIGWPAAASNASMQVSPRPSSDGTINEIIDADNPLMFNIPGYNLCPRTKLLELQEMCLLHLDLTYLAIVSGDLDLSNDPDLELGDLGLLVEHDIQLD